MFKFLECGPGRGPGGHTVGGIIVENQSYAAILDAMPKTGVYVIREADHGVLYLNRRMREIVPGAALDCPCPKEAGRVCGICLLPTMGDRQQLSAVSYDARFGGVVDVTAARILWEGSVPAVVVTVNPRSDTPGYTYRKVLHVDLERDRCDVLKSGPEQWMEGDEPLSRSFERLARSGAIHPEDVERFIAFTRIEHLRSAARSGGEALTLVYRRRTDGEYHWNLMEVLSWGTGGNSALICIKDVHKVLREGLERRA